MGLNPAHPRIRQQKQIIHGVASPAIELIPAPSRSRF